MRLRVNGSNASITNVIRWVTTVNLTELGELFKRLKNTISFLLKIQMTAACVRLPIAGINR